MSSRFPDRSSAELEGDAETGESATITVETPLSMMTSPPAITRPMSPARSVLHQSSKCAQLPCMDDEPALPLLPSKLCWSVHPRCRRINRVPRLTEPSCRSSFVSVFFLGFLFRTSAKTLHYWNCGARLAFSLRSSLKT